MRFVAVVGYSLGLIFGDDPARGLAVSKALTDSLSGADIPPIGDPGQHDAIQLLGLLQTGAVAQAREVADTAYRSTAVSPSVQARAWAAMSLGHAAELAGDLATAARVLAEADRLWAAVRVWGFAVWCGAALTRVQVMRGDVEEAAATLARTQGYPRPPQMLNGHLLDIAAAWVAHGQGDRGAAVAALRAALTQVQASGSMTNLAETWHEAAHVDLLADLTDSTGATGDWGRPVGPLAAVRYDFVQARVRGSGGEIGSAATRFEEFGMSLYAAEAASSAATAYRRQGLAKEAARWEATTAALSAELGPVSLPLLGARSSSGVLTAREAQIARLAAGGLSNRQIAARLVVSERTVENHLYRCFTKLAVTGRDQLAHALASEAVSN